MNMKTFMRPFWEKKHRIEVMAEEKRKSYLSLSGCSCRKAHSKTKCFSSPTTWSEQWLQSLSERGMWGLESSPVSIGKADESVKTFSSSCLTLKETRTQATPCDVRACVMPLPYSSGSWTVMIIQFEFHEHMILLPWLAHVISLVKPVEFFFFFFFVKQTELSFSSLPDRSDLKQLFVAARQLRCYLITSRLEKDFQLVTICDCQD